MGACYCLAEGGSRAEGLVLDRESPPRSALIWLHGLGDTERKWSQTIKHELLPLLDSCCSPCKLVVPRAPTAEVSCNGGRRMTCWFDMRELPLGAGNRPPRFGCSLPDAELSAQRIHGIIDDLCEMGLAPERIAIGGFSQGAALAMLSALKYPAPLGCCIAFSGLLLGSDQLARIVHPANHQLPVLWCHGQHDPLLMPSLQRVGCEALESMGVRVQKRRYSMGHGYRSEELGEAAAFLADRLASGPGAPLEGPDGTAAKEATEASQGAPELIDCPSVTVEELKEAPPSCCCCSCCASCCGRSTSPGGVAACSPFKRSGD
mmetsp:Transcript_14886/g.43470  ORF Transcript_14886/g.43470 Transcript_14886/m.43470 type:complete len:319 (+) Transcript_14886:95-1051(+)